MPRKRSLRKGRSQRSAKTLQKKKYGIGTGHASQVAEARDIAKIEAAEKLSSRARQAAQLVGFYEALRGRAISASLTTEADRLATRKVRSDAVPCLDRLRVLASDLSPSTLRRYAACLQYGLDKKFSVKAFAGILFEHGLTALARLYDETRALPKREYRRDETYLLAATKEYFKQCLPCGSAQLPAGTTSNNSEFLLLIATPVAKSNSATLKFVSADKRLVEAVLLMARPANLLKE